MKHLRLDVYDLPEHAQTVMTQLGITYQHATPQSMGEQWWFWNCENLPNELPSYLEVLDIDPHSAIGYGLSKEQADKIADYAAQQQEPPHA